MPKLDPLKVGLVVLILVIIAATGWWALQPYFAQRANKAASAKVTQTIQAAKPKEEKAVNLAQEKTNERIVQVETRVQRVVVRVPTAPDPDAVFFDGVCDSELYEGDSQCGGRGSSGGEVRPSR